MAELNPNSNPLLLWNKIKELKHQLKQFETLLGICPFNLEDIKGEKGDKGDIFSYADFTPTQIAELQKPATDKVVELDALEISLNNSESLRVQNENARISNEEIRTTNENDRISSENSRQENEVSRQENENERILAETERNDTEIVRISNENTRISSENTRNTNEQTRVNAENNRVTAETSRVNSENTRITSETERVSNENIRKTAETSRANAENARVSNESSRVTAESSRVTAENARVNAENTRISNATDKIAETETARQNAITATTNANTATTNATNAANTANTSAANADAKALLAEEAATKANTAAANANAIVMNSIYGVRIDNAVSNPILTRLGSSILHQTLPIQSLMRRCLLKADGTVNYYLDANNSTLKENGTAAVLDGTDGDVMVEIPKHYRRVDIITSTITEVWISQTNLPGFEEIPLMYISAYQATVDRTVPATPKLASVVNTTANFRGGNNNAAWDAESRTLLGRPASNISRTNARNYARNKGAAGKNGAGWNQLTYNAYKSLFWLYFVEYANKNSQATFNSALDANGYRQGGLGAGVTDLNGTKWSTFNSYYPFVPMGFTNSLGNKTGVLPFTMPAEYDSVPFTTYVPSYRGVENPFGHIWHWVDGINVKTQAADAGGRTVYFATDNPSLFQDSNYTGFREVGDSPRANGYVKSLILGQFADFLAKENTGAGTTTYWTDYYYQNIPSAGEVLRGLRVGGAADHGASAGLAYSATHYAPSNTSAYIGLRLCYLP